MTPSAKLAKVNLLQIVSGSRVVEDELEVMATKRGRPAKDQVSTEQHTSKSSKSELRTKEHRPRRRIGIQNLLISRGQDKYSILKVWGINPST